MNDAMTPAVVYVLAVTRAVIARHSTFATLAARETALARVSALLDDGHDVDLAELPRSIASVHDIKIRSDMDERIESVGASRCFR